MLPWTRPEPHADFEADAKKLLDAVRADIVGGKLTGEALGKVFKNREIWSGKWSRRSQTKGLHKYKLAEPDHWLAKCAWCERLYELGRDLDVEHYRPKAEVSEWQGSPPSISDTPPKQVRCSDGYWWLAFSWTNFSLACRTCNQHWKRSLFPVRHPRHACSEGVEYVEEPLLLDPASKFVTREHFRWDVLSGIIEGVSDEGRATIITCGLNRAGLRSLRSKAALDTRTATKAFLRAWGLGSKARAADPRARLIALTSDAEEFTSMRRWIVEQTFGVPWEELASGVLVQSTDG